MEAWYKALSVFGLIGTAICILCLWIMKKSREKQERAQKAEMERLKNEIQKKTEQVDLAIELHESDQKVIDLLKSRTP